MDDRVFVDASGACMEFGAVVTSGPSLHAQRPAAVVEIRRERR